jgi:hypothetical protein
MSHPTMSSPEPRAARPLGSGEATGSANFMIKTTYSVEKLSSSVFINTLEGNFVFQKYPLSKT